MFTNNSLRSGSVPSEYLIQVPVTLVLEYSS